MKPISTAREAEKGCLWMLKCFHRIVGSEIFGSKTKNGSHGERPWNAWAIDGIDSKTGTNEVRWWFQDADISTFFVSRPQLFSDNITWMFCCRCSGVGGCRNAATTDGCGGQPSSTMQRIEAGNSTVLESFSQCRGLKCSICICCTLRFLESWRTLRSTLLYMGCYKVQSEYRK